MAKIKTNSNRNSNSEGRGQSGLRASNERRILALIRKHGSAPKAEIAQELGLSAQAVTVIIKSLEKENLLLRKEPQRGRVGQPLVPFALNPDGAFGIGLKVDRRSFDLTLIDFVGNVKASLHENCDYPSVTDLLAFLKRGVEMLTLSLNQELTTRITGIGVATPYEIWNWAEEAGAPADVLNEWKTFDFSERLTDIIDLPVYVCNDDTAACSAELSFGNPNRFSNFLYVFISTFIGGGVVLNGALLTGTRGNAGAIGSLPLPTLNSQGKLESQQLIMHSSLYILENMLTEAGRDTGGLTNSSDYWGDLGESLEIWIDMVAEGLTYATLCSSAIFDFEAIIIDGAIPISVRDKIVNAVAIKVQESDTRGLSHCQVVSGTIGSKAQSIGCANLPLLVNFTQDLQQLVTPQAQ
ncbi:ROK family transcriptional regulator [Paraglaciecola chathamensis]|jgi:predicted NBD/HSP70 family sugar kinase|uniref:ROK family transcriptional regulator n=1 Tax=Paraglaciecola chathamensis TaxID=368405 RepID=A0ABS0WH66_9ALTE|nr:ROK family transcriptional regulator [Paraglaciecola chathamensis]MBJ2137798.1 ROK family transcriptional regulator [Paraglaciecola chathamensis]